MTKDSLCLYSNKKIRWT